MYKVFLYTYCFELNIVEGLGNAGKGWKYKFMLGFHTFVRIPIPKSIKVTKISRAQKHSGLKWNLDLKVNPRGVDVIK